MDINAMGQLIYQGAVLHGFYDMCPGVKDPVWLSNRLMLVVSELSEALEGIRANNFASTPGSGGLGEELADACIRIFDLAYSVGIDLDAAIRCKHEFNQTRSYKHGGKAL